MSFSEILNKYRKDVVDAYAQARAASDAEGEEKGTAIGVCGALVTAAGKRALRDFYLEALKAELRHNTIEITATNISQSMIRVIGRKANTAWITEHFGTPGRTSANKSSATEKDFADFERRTAPKVAKFKQELAEIRRLAKH